MKRRWMIIVPLSALLCIGAFMLYQHRVCTATLTGGCLRFGEFTFHPSSYTEIGDYTETSHLICKTAFNGGWSVYEIKEYPNYEYVIVRSAWNAEVYKNDNIQDETAITQNPIDVWYQKTNERYGNSHTDGFIGYVYGNAWKSELKHLVETINSAEADAYYEAVEKEHSTIISLMRAEEEENGWATGSSGRVSMAGAMVYKNGLYQLHSLYSDFIFNTQAADQELIEGGINVQSISPNRD